MVAAIGRTLCVLALAALPAFVAATAVDGNAFTVHKMSRTISALKHVVVSNSTWKISGNGASKFYFCLSNLADNVLHVAAESDSESGVEKYEVRRDLSVDAQPGCVHYMVNFRKAVTAELGVKITISFKNALVPKPKTITQYEQQFVELTFPAYFVSPYRIEKQSTTVKLPVSGAGIENFSKSPEPVAVDAKSVKFGPYSDIAPYTVEPVSVHFQSDAVFSTLSSVEREVEVSMWGNVAFEENYDLRNSGAELDGGFSRLDYQSRNAKGNSFISLKAILPRDATDVYYRDVIGNISTSHVNRGSKHTTMEIDTRFPLFGGWKIQWYQGYNAPASQFVTSNSDGSYTLSFDAHIPFGAGGDHVLPIEDYLTKIILPEGATDVEVTPLFPGTRVTHSRRFTYLDSPWTGRPVVNLHARDVLSSGLPNAFVTGNITVTYRMPAMFALRKGLFVTAAFAAMFLVFIFASRIKYSLPAYRKAGAGVPVAKKNA